MEEHMMGPPSKETLKTKMKCYLVDLFNGDAGMHHKMRSYYIKAIKA